MFGLIWIQTIVFLQEFFEKKLILKIISRQQKKNMKNYPVGKELTMVEGPSIIEPLKFVGKLFYFLFCLTEP